MPVNISLITYKVYFKIRARISSRLFYFLERFILFRMNSAVAQRQSPSYFFFPVEVQLDQRSEERLEEIDELRSCHTSGSLPGFLRNLSKMERNRSYKYNAFYPLFSISSANDLSSISAKDKELIRDYIHHWIQIFLKEGRANEFCWYDMAYSYRMIFFYFLKAGYREFNLTNADLKNLHYAIQIHEQVLIKDELLSKGNHRIFQILARICIGEARQDNSFFEAEKKRLSDFLKTQFSNEGFHLEHSPEYHLWATYILQNLVSKYTFQEDLNDLISLATANSSLFITPNKTIPLIGDSSVDNIESYLKMFFKKSIDRSCHSRDYLIEKNDADGWYFISLLSANSAVHKHHDSCSYELFMGGGKIISDSGKYLYATDDLSRSLRNVKAHNLAYIKDDEHLFSKQHYKCTATGKSNTISYVTCRAETGDAVHQRTFVYDRKSFLMVVDSFVGTSLIINSNITLINGDSYEQVTGVSIPQYVSEVIGVEIMLLNTSEARLEETMISEEYGKLKKEKRLGCSANGYLATLISKPGNLNIIRTESGGYEIGCDEGIIFIENSGEKVTFQNRKTRN